MSSARYKKYKKSITIWRSTIFEGHCSSCNDIPGDVAELVRPPYNLFPDFTFFLF